MINLIANLFDNAFLKNPLSSNPLTLTCVSEGGTRRKSTKPNTRLGEKKQFKAEKGKNYYEVSQLEQFSNMTFDAVLNILYTSYKFQKALRKKT